MHGTLSPHDAKLRDELFGRSYPLTERNKNFSHEDNIHSWSLPEGDEKAYLSLFACFEYVAERGGSNKRLAEILNKYDWISADNSDAPNNILHCQALGKAFSHARRFDGGPNEQFDEAYQKALIERKEFESLSDPSGQFEISYWQNAACPEARVRLWGSVQEDGQFIRTSLDVILPSNLANAVRRAKKHDSIAGHFIRNTGDESRWLSYSRYHRADVAVGKTYSRGRDHTHTRFYSVMTSHDIKEREGWSNYKLPDIYLGISNERSYA